MLDKTRSLHSSFVIKRRAFFLPHSSSRTGLLQRSATMKLWHVAFAVFCCLLSHHVTFTVSNTTVRLTSEASCPDAAALAAADPASVRQIVGVSDARVCSVACALWNQCAVTRYLASTRTCQLGNQAAWLQLWRLSAATSNSSTMDCTSLVRPPLPPSTLLSKLLALYNFRFGTDNLATANPGAFPAASASSSMAVQKTRVGFNLTANLNSYVQVDLGGSPLRARLGSSRKVTIFARVTPATGQYQPYVIFLVQNRSQLIEPNYSIKWLVNVFGTASFVYLDLSSNMYQSVETASGIRSMFSAAVSFDPSITSARFYYNGTWLTTAVPVIPDSFAILGDEVVRIGYDAMHKYSGIVHCIAVAADTLETSELEQIEGVC